MQAHNQRYARAYHDIISPRPLQSPFLALKYIPPLGYTMSSLFCKSFSATFRFLSTFFRHRLALGYGFSVLHSSFAQSLSYNVTPGCLEAIMLKTLVNDQFKCIGSAPFFKKCSSENTAKLELITVSPFFLNLFSLFPYYLASKNY